MALKKYGPSSSAPDIEEKDSDIEDAPVSSIKTYGPGKKDRDVEPAFVADTAQDAINYYQKTGKVAQGYELVPTPPTDDASTPRYLLRKVGSPRQQTNKTQEPLFGYEGTTRAASALYKDGNDILADEEMLVKYVPSYLRPFVRVTAKGADMLVVKPLAIGLTGIGETASDAMNAFTRAVQEGVIEGSTFERITGLTGKDLIPFDPETSGRKFTGDLIQLAEVSDAPVVVSAIAAKAAMQSQMKRLAQDTGKKLPTDIVVPRNLDTSPVTGGNVLNLGKVDEQVLRAAKLGAEKLGFGVRTVRGVDPSPSGAMIAKGELARQQRETEGLRLGDVVEKTREVEAAKQAEAAKVAAENSELTEQLIHNYEDVNELGRGGISKKVNGKTVIDYEKAREVGLTKLDDLGINADEAFEMGMGPEGFRSPLLNPDKLDAVTAVIADIKALNPEAFAGNKNVIETLFRENVNQNLIASEDILNIIDKYGLSMDEYIQMVVGTGSRAGTTLRKFRDMREAMGGTTRTKNAAQKAQDDLDNAVSGWGKTKQNIRRMENVVRGALVSAFGTAARNFESTIIRFPMEGLANVFEEGIVRAGKAVDLAKSGDKQGAAKQALTAAETFIPFAKNSAWKDSFSMYSHMFSDPLKAKELTDFILNQPENQALMTKFYDQVNEVMAATGRGEGGVSDMVFNPIEDFVQFLNGPNRMQEFLARRAYFMNDMERLLKREWGIDLQDTIKKGKVRELINDSPQLRPTNGNNPPRTFAEITADAAMKALDKTYASPPKFGMFQHVLKFLNTTPGSTFVIPFPRFMFKSMEYIPEIVAGLPMATSRRLLGIGKNRAYDAEMAARNLAGLTFLGTTYMMVSSEDAPSSPTEVRNIDGSVTDVTPQFPLAQGMFMSKYYNLMNKDGKEVADDWLAKNWDTAVQIYTGTNFRQNQSFGDLFSDVSDYMNENNTLTGKEALAKGAGGFFGNFATRILQPYSMVIDAERALGMRDPFYKLYGGDPDLSGEGAFVSGFMSKLHSRGYISPEKEAEAKNREYPMAPGGKQRLGSAYKLALGLNIKRADTPQEKFLKDLNYRELDFMSRTGIRQIDNTVHDLLNDWLPMIADLAKDREPIIKEKLKKENRDTRMDMILEQRTTISKQVSNIKQRISKYKFKDADNPQYIQLVNAARSFPEDVQKLAMRRYAAKKQALTGEAVDLGDVNDLLKIIQEAKNIR